MVGLGEHTHRRARTSAAEGCVKCVNCLFWDCDPDLTRLCLKFLQEPGFSAVGFEIVHTLDLLLILTLKVSVLTLTTGGLTYLCRLLADPTPV